MGEVDRQIGQRLRRLREARDLSADDLAKLAGITPGTYRCLEEGHYALSVGNLSRLLKVLEAEIGDVWPS